jgi:transcriptional regulator with XRE-family HTH domain
MAAKMGARIRELREERGLSLVELAEASGVSKGHMSSVERGLVLVTLETIMAAAKGLGVPPFLVLAFREDEPMAAMVEHVRQAAGGNIQKAAVALRKAAFGAKAKKPAPAPPRETSKRVKKERRTR